MGSVVGKLWIITWRDEVGNLLRFIGWSGYQVMNLPLRGTNVRVNCTRLVHQDIPWGSAQLWREFAVRGRIEAMKNGQVTAFTVTCPFDWIRKELDSPKRTFTSCNKLVNSVARRHGPGEAILSCTEWLISFAIPVPSCSQLPDHNPLTSKMQNGCQSGRTTWIMTIIHNNEINTWFLYCLFMIFREYLHRIDLYI